MNQATEGNNPDALELVGKRKRGRPRKYPKLNTEDNARVPKIHEPKLGVNAVVPPGFGGANGNQPRPVVQPTNNSTTDAMVGKAVSGVIEAVFDAGYLLSVRVANSDTTLRGVVFKAGRYVPVSAENDVAPNVQMIRRNEVPFPTEHHNPRSKERKEQQGNAHRDGAHLFSETPVANQIPRVASYSGNHVASKGKQVPSMAAQTGHLDPVTSRGNLVPVVLQPANKSNGSPVVSGPTPLAIQASHQGTSKGKQVQEAAHRLNGSISTNHVPTNGSQEVLSHPQTSHQPTPEGSQNENNGCHQPLGEMLLDAEAKSMRLPGKPFENLVTEVIKRIEAPSQSAEAQNVNGKLADKTSIKHGEAINNFDQALAIEPLQAVQLEDNNHPASAPKSMEDDRSSKMSQLLEVLQETMTESQVPQADGSAGASTQTVSETSSLVTESRDKETGNLKGGPGAASSV